MLECHDTNVGSREDVISLLQGDADVRNGPPAGIGHEPFAVLMAVGSQRAAGRIQDRRFGQSPTGSGSLIDH